MKYKFIKHFNNNNKQTRNVEERSEERRQKTGDFRHQISDIGQMTKNQITRNQKALKLRSCWLISC